MPASILGVTRRGLRQIHAAGALDDLRIPPGNKLHPLTRDHAGQHAIRIDDRFRVGRYVGMTPDFWLNLQRDYEIENLTRSVGQEIERIAPLAREAA